MQLTRSLDRRQSLRGAVIALLLLSPYPEARVGTLSSAPLHPHHAMEVDLKRPGFDPVNGTTFDLSEMHFVEAAAAKAADGRTPDTQATADAKVIPDSLSPYPPTRRAAVHPETDVPQSIRRWRRDSGKASAVYVLDPLLASRINALLDISPTFESAWANLQESGVPILIGTDSQLHDQIPRAQRDVRWAGITTSWGDGRAYVTRSAVAIRLDWLRDLHDKFGNSDALFQEALDQLIIHEVYGHLVPVVAAGTLQAACPDAVEGELHRDSCVGRRELAIQAEIEQVRNLAFASAPR